MGQPNREYLEEFRVTPAGQSLLRTIRYAEGTNNDSPYNTLFGGGKFDDLSRHPDKVINSSRYSSSAAGAYQFLTPTWQSVKNELGLEDFGPESQDIAALRLAQKRLSGIGGLETVRNEGLSKRVAAKLSPEWASFPTESGKSYYGQPVKSLEELQSRYGMTQPVAGQPAPPTESPKQKQNVTASEPATQQAEIDSQQSTTSGPYNSNVGQAIKNAVLNMAFSGSDRNINAFKANRYYAAADQLDELDTDEADDRAAQLRMQANELSRPSLDSNLSAGNLLVALMKDLRDKKPTDQISPIEKTTENLEQTQVRQRAEVQSETKQAKLGQNKNIIITDPADSSGEPGFDYVVEGGKRGAEYYSPFENATVLKVVNDQNWETDLVSDPNGQRGYGNRVELRFAGPEGKEADTLIAHFDSINPELKPGMKIGKGAFIGTQGRTGSTTGAHISMDFYQPGTATPNIEARDFVLGKIR